MRKNLSSIPVLVGGAIITIVVLTWGTTRVGISSAYTLLFAILFVFPSAMFHGRSVYLMVTAIFIATSFAMEWYLERGTGFLSSSAIFWVTLFISAEVIHQISTQRRRADQLSHRRALELEAMDATMAELSTDLTIDRFLQQIVERAAKLLDAAICELALYDKEREDLEIVANYPFIEKQIGIRLKLGEGSMGRTALSKQPSIINDYKSWSNAMSSDITTGVEAVLDVPLLKGDELIGVLGIGRYDRNSNFTEDDKSLLNVFGRQATIAIQNARLYQEIQTLAFTDGLTNINNRRRLFELAEKEFARAKRYHRPLSLMLMDIDHFKVINDRYGHAVGDMVLRWFALESRKSIRDNIDILGRFGGEEFAIIFPETEMGTSYKIAKRLHQRICNGALIAPDQNLQITFSAGIASLNETIDSSLDQLLDHADKALYKAKELRNCIAFWDDQETAAHLLQEI